MGLRDYSQKLSRRHMIITICYCAIVIATVTLYFTFAIRCSAVGFTSGLCSPFGLGRNHNAYIDDEDDEAFDRFLLSPKQHVFRSSQTIQLTWNVTKGVRTPDGVYKDIFLINNLFPGPTIEARNGDKLEINVFNSIHNGDSTGIAIHWHGLFMKGANEMDGVVGITQCAIPPGKNYTYEFQIDDQQAGTFWYHAHSALQRADGLYGGIVIHEPVHTRASGSEVLREFAPEKLLLIGDWYHQPADAVLAWYKHPDHFGYEPAPDSLLINGKGYFNCSRAVKARPINCTAVETPPIRLPKSDVVRLRIVNTGVSSGLSLAVSHGGLKLVNVDGGSSVSDSVPETKAIGVLYPGERMDLLAFASDANPPKSTLLSIILDEENMPLINFALTTIQTFPLEWPHEGTNQIAETGLPARTVVEVWSLKEAKGPLLEPDSRVGSPPDETSVLYTALQVMSSDHNRPFGDVNRTSWIVADPNADPMIALDPNDWSTVSSQPHGVQNFTVPRYAVSGANKERWMELVVNNMDDKGHPFHMHGHSFHVVLVHQDELRRPYNPFNAPQDMPPPNTIDPVQKDTIYIPARGYVVLRLPLNNEGLWLLHCHVLWHQAVGMGIVMQMGDIQPHIKEKAARFCASSK